MHTLLLLHLTVAAPLQAESPFSFAVTREKLTRDEPGQLEIDDSGIRFKADKGDAAIVLPFADIRKADVSDPQRIRFETYDVAKRRLGGRRTMEFKLREGTHTEALGRFLSVHLKRPVIGAYGLANEGAFEVPAYHRELLGGSHGTLQIGPDGILFVSKRPKDSRTWLYRDIETIGTATPFHFRLTSFAESFTVELKNRLPESAYQLAWSCVYGLDKDRNTSWTEKQ